MTTIVTRAGKGSPLTHTEVDTNFTNLNTNKFETAAIPLGTLAAPSISFVGDANTGAYSPGADTLAFVTAGSNRVHITSAGLVGIGTSSPSTNTEINAALDTGAGLALNEGQLSIGREANSGGAVRIGYDTTNNFGFISSGRVGTSWDKLILNAGGGNVGIGSNSPGGTLDIKAAASTHPLIVQGPSSEFARVDSSGRLLIGTSTSNTGALSQYSFLQAKGNSQGSGGAGQMSLFRDENSSAIIADEVLGRIIFGDQQAGEYGQIHVAADGTAAVGDYPGRLVFSTTADGASSPTERMRINNAGTLIVYGSTSNSSVYNCLYYNSSSADLFRVRNDGYFITGSATQSPYNLTTGSAANVNIDANGGLQRVTSSLKYKKDVADAAHGLAELLQLRSVTYKGKGDNDGDIVFGGLIAEEVDAAGLSEFVQYAPDGSPDSLAYGNMVSLCIKAIQEQQLIITELQAEVAALKAQ